MRREVAGAPTPVETSVHAVPVRRHVPGALGVFDLGVRYGGVEVVVAKVTGKRSSRPRRTTDEEQTQGIYIRDTGQRSRWELGVGVGFRVVVGFGLELGVRCW